MKTLVVYDSLYGNTEKVARAIAQAIGAEAKLKLVGNIHRSDLRDTRCLIIGSPTQGGKPKPETRAFLNNIPPNGLSGMSAATFDTRLLASKNNPFMSLLLKTAGYAAPKIAKQLQAKGANLVASPHGFIVNGKEGPLRKGELERAAVWAKGITAA